MQIQVQVGEMIIEWDSNQAAINVKKHGVNFKRAAEVFLDENRYEELDELHSYFEDRYMTIGMVDNILTVVYTERGEAKRIISARKATKRERMIYYASQNAYLPRYED